MSSRPVHFEIHADDPTRAAKFYAELFGWQFTLWAGADYWAITTGPDAEPGINGGLLKRKGAHTGDRIVAFICTIKVDDVDAVIAKAADLGGKIALPKMPIPGVGWLAYCKDTEENVFGVMSEDPSAK